MRPLLPLLLPLAACNQTPAALQSVIVNVGADVLAGCGQVRWTEPAINRLGSLAPQQGLGYLAAGGSAWSSIPVDWVSGSAVLQNAGRYDLLNITGSNLGSLDSTFTCVGTGQTVRASVRLPGLGNSAQTILKVEGGQLAADWTVLAAPD